MNQQGLKALLYVSQVTDGYEVGCIAAILSTARHNNAIYGETGVLLFDGERFCQYVEGEASNIDALKANLLKDARHQNVVVLAEQAAAQRVFSDFRMGYADLDDADALDGVAQCLADEAIARFLKVAETSDVEA